MRLSPLRSHCTTRCWGLAPSPSTVLGEDIEAADWGRASRAVTGAPMVLIALIAVVTNALADNHVRAASWAENVRSRNPTPPAQDDFFSAFPIKSGNTRGVESRSPSRALGLETPPRHASARARYVIECRRRLRICERLLENERRCAVKFFATLLQHSMQTTGGTIVTIADDAKCAPEPELRAGECAI